MMVKRKIPPSILILFIVFFSLIWNHVYADVNVESLNVDDAWVNPNQQLKFTAQLLNTTSNQPPTVWGLSFDGVDDYINVSAGPSLDITSDKSVTVTFWFNMPNTSLFRNVMIKDMELAISVGGVNLAFKDNCGNGYSVSRSLNNNLWYFFAGQYDKSADVVRIYLNGVLISSGLSGKWSPSPTTRIFTIGNGKYPNVGPAARFYKGFIGEVRIYNRTLTSDEISRIYNYGEVITDGLVLWLSPSSIIGNTWYDLSGYNNHGTLYNDVTKLLVLNMLVNGTATPLPGTIFSNGTAVLYANAPQNIGIYNYTLTAIYNNTLQPVVKTVMVRVDALKITQLVTDVYNGYAYAKLVYALDDQPIANGIVSMLGSQYITNSSGWATIDLRSFNQFSSPLVQPVRDYQHGITYQLQSRILNAYKTQIADVKIRSVNPIVNAIRGTNYIRFTAHGDTVVELPGNVKPLLVYVNGQPYSNYEYVNNEVRLRNLGSDVVIYTTTTSIPSFYNGHLILSPSFYNSHTSLTLSGGELLWRDAYGNLYLANSTSNLSYIYLYNFTNYRITLAYGSDWQSFNYTSDVVAVQLPTHPITVQINYYAYENKLYIVFEKPLPKQTEIPIPQLGENTIYDAANWLRRVWGDLSYAVFLLLPISIYLKKRSVSLAAASLTLLGASTLAVGGMPETVMNIAKIALALGIGVLAYKVLWRGGAVE